MRKIVLKNVLAVMLILLFVQIGNSCQDLKHAKTDSQEKFKSVAYVALGMLRLHTMEPYQIFDVLDNYRWEGITDIVLIGGVFQTGKNWAVSGLISTTSSPLMNGKPKGIER